MYGANNVLEHTLKDILDVIKPLQEDLLMRVKLIEDIQEVVESVDSLRGAIVEPCGSFVSNLFTRWSDLDISIMLTDGSHISFPARKRKQRLLGDLLGALGEKGGWRKLQFISDARLPILKLDYGYPGISCEISIGNLPGQMKSKFLYWINEIDGRFRDMVLLVKEWAKAHNINNPKFGTLSTYSLCLLVIFHFQTCDPAILPPLKDIYPGNLVDDLTGVRIEAEERIEQTCRANILRYRRQINRSSVSELFASFLAKFSDLSLKAQALGICTFTGQWEDIRSNTRWLPRTYALFIEDPFQQPENTARGISDRNVGKISEAFRTTHHGAISPHNQISLLRSLVGPKVSQLIAGRPVSNPGYSTGRTHPQHSSNVHAQTQLVHRPLNGRPDNSTSKRKEHVPSRVTKQKPEDNLKNLTKQRQGGHSNNSSMQRPAQPNKNQAQPMWRPKSEKSNA